MSSSMPIGCGTRCGPRHQGLAITITAFMFALPARASATDAERSIGFDLRLRAPDVMLVARRTRHKKSRHMPAAPSPSEEVPPAAPPAPVPTADGSPDLDFNLLGPGEPAGKPAPVDEAKVKLRRKMLTYHPLLGIGLLVCETATVVLGQLNYNDRFGGGPSSGRYQFPHKVLAWSTEGLFLGTGALALFAPDPMGKTHEGFDRVLLHKIAMIIAGTGMVTELGLGIYTASREGYLNQASLARTHLAIGYITLAATYLGVGTIVF
jgi:hypothetical protein